MMLYALLRLSPVVISPPCHAICLLVATATECTQKKNGCEKVERSTAISPSTSHECVRSRLLCYSTLLLEEEQGMNFPLVRKGIIEIVIRMRKGGKLHLFFPFSSIPRHRNPLSGKAVAARFRVEEQRWKEVEVLTTPFFFSSLILS